jgi:hypothetical protein
MNVIHDHYFQEQLYSWMREHLNSDFYLLINLEDNEPNSFINEFYIKFQQQLLDGNSNFMQTRLFSLESYLKRAFENFLIGKVRILRTKLKSRPILQSEIMEHDVSWDPPEGTAIKPESKAYAQDILLEAILCIPSDESDKGTLRSALIEVFESPRSFSEIEKREAKQALLKNASYIIDALEENIKKLPIPLQEKLKWYAENKTAVFLRNLRHCDQAMRNAGYNRQWFAEQLGTSKNSLEDWIRLEKFPKKETVEMVSEQLAGVITTLDISGGEKK